MTFSAVSWKFRDPVTIAKLAQMVENITTHDHRADGTQGKPTIGRCAAGQLSEGGRTAAGVGQTAIPFPAGRFAKPPRVVVGVVTTGNTSQFKGWGVSDVSATSAIVWIDRVNATVSTFTYHAIERDS